MSEKVFVTKIDCQISLEENWNEFAQVLELSMSAEQLELLHLVFYFGASNVFVRVAEAGKTNNQEFFHATMNNLYEDIDAVMHYRRAASTKVTGRA